MAVATCPKCEAPIAPAASACPKCGLAVAKMESFAKARDAAIPDALGRAWEAAEASWDDAARHEEVLRLVTQHDAYAWAAARYKQRAGDPVADRGLERVKKAAEATLLTSGAAREAKARNPYRNTMVLMIGMLLLLLGGLMYAYLRSSGPAPTPPTVDPAPN